MEPLFSFGTLEVFNWPQPLSVLMTYDGSPVAVLHETEEQRTLGITVDEEGLTKRWLMVSFPISQIFSSFEDLYFSRECILLDQNMMRGFEESLAVKISSESLPKKYLPSGEIPEGFFEPLSS